MEKDEAEGPWSARKPSLHLVRIESDSKDERRFPSLNLKIGKPTVAGRVQLGISDKRVSRQQADLELQMDNRVYVTLGGVNPSVIRHRNGDETVLTRKGERGEMRHGSMVHLMREDHLYRLEDKCAHDSPSGEDGIGIDTQPTQQQDLDEVPKKRSPLKRTKLDGEELKNEGSESLDFSQESDPKSKRRRFSGQSKPELIPLEFEFDENGGKVKVIDLTHEDHSSQSGTSDFSNRVLEVAQVLPHLERSVIRKTLQRVDGNVEAAINVLLGITEETSSDVHDTQTDDDELAGSLVTVNSFTKAEPYYHLNWLPKFPASANEGALRLREIIPECIERAVIVTYQVDMDWLMRRCPVLKRIPWSLIHGERNPRQVLPYPPPPNVHYHKPHVLEYGCHHGKMMLLFWKDKLRIAITTANLLEKDYERKTQGIWLQDFPKKRGERAGQSTSLAKDFEDTLVDYFTHMGNEQHLQFRASSLRNYDYSAVRVALVTSVPGYHSRHTLHRYGHMRLRTLLANEVVPKEIMQHSTLACQFSSVGSLNMPWIKEFGQSLMNSAQASESSVPISGDGVELVWPTVEFVRNSIDGYPAGGSLCFGLSNLRDFMEPLFRRYEAMQKGRGVVTPHIKCYARHRDSHLAWLCLTSANLSKAAWGALQKGNTQLMIRNYEIGVLFLPSNFDNRTFMAGAAPGELSTDTVVMPLPYRIEPLERYTSKDMPWIWDRTYPEPDSHGATWGV